MCTTRLAASTCDFEDELTKQAASGQHPPLYFVQSTTVADANFMLWQCPLKRSPFLCDRVMTRMAPCVALIRQCTRGQNSAKRFGRKHVRRSLLFH